GYARLLAGDIARRRGDLGAAVAAYRSGAAALAGAADGDRLAAALNLAEALVAAGDPDAGRAALSESRTPAEVANQADAWQATALRIALALDEPIDAARAAELDRVRARAATSGRRDLAFRTDLLSARIHIRRRERQRALVCLERAAETWKEIRM